MLLGTVRQQSREKKAYSIDYSEALDAGDGVEQIEACFAEPDALVADPVLVSGSRARIWVSGGVDGQTYKITIRVLTSGGEILEDELLCRVKDI